MRLISEIIEQLSADAPSLENALFKAQVLAHRLGEEPLKKWVEQELRGYQSREEVPPYRVIPVTVLANITNGHQRHEEFPVPLAKVDSRLRSTLEHTHLVQSIIVIDKWSKSGENLSVVLASELYGELSKGLGNGFFVQRAWGKHSVGAMAQVVMDVRSRLLEFALQASDRIPREPESEQLKDLSREVSVGELFKNAVFGPNATIVVGSGSIQGVTNSVVQNDIASLVATLKAAKLGDDDIESLKAAIAADEGTTDPSQKAFGPSVRDWIGNTVKKAASGAWQISIGAAGNILGAALAAYYGFGAS
jgi:hypothetical protein